MTIRGLLLELLVSPFGQENKYCQLAEISRYPWTMMKFLKVNSNSTIVVKHKFKDNTSEVCQAIFNDEHVGSCFP